MKSTLIQILAALTFISCSSENLAPDTNRVGFDYFPLQVGDSVLYDVEEINYDIVEEADTSTFLLKTVVADSFISQSGDVTYIIYRYEKDLETDPWQFITAWSAYRNSNQAVVVEENIPYLKLTFPIEDDKMWDGNRLNTMEEDIYILDSIGFAYDDEIVFDNTVTVIQNNADDILQTDRRAEIYASGVGLIYREEVLLNYCSDPNCIGQQQIEDGRVYIQKVRSETN